MVRPINRPEIIIRMVAGVGMGVGVGSVLANPTCRVKKPSGVRVGNTAPFRYRDMELFVTVMSAFVRLVIVLDKNVLVTSEEKSGRVSLMSVNTR